MADPETAVDSSENMEDVEEEEEETVDNKDNITAELMKNPAVLAAVQSRLNSIIGAPSGYIASLPKPIKRRIKALKKLQLEFTKQEAEFYKEVHLLECKYQQKYQPLYQKRATITSGEYEPTEEECDFPSDVETDEETEEVKVKKEVKEEPVEDVTKGIPEFWSSTLKNVDDIAEMIQEHDEPILKHLTDIKVSYTESDPMGFKLEFVFSSNEYFTNTVLTKEYVMSCVPDEDAPFSFDGPEIIKSKGCTINWVEGKNVTMKTIKKKQKHKSKGSVRVVTKTIQNDSFFNFFNTPEVPEDKDDEIDDETKALLCADFEIGHYIRDRIVPHAVLYFTGEALEDEYDDEEEEDEEGGEDGEEEDDPDYVPKVKGSQ